MVLFQLVPLMMMWDTAVRALVNFNAFRFAMRTSIQYNVWVLVRAVPECLHLRLPPHVTVADNSDYQACVPTVEAALRGLLSVWDYPCFHSRSSGGVARLFALSA